MAEISSSQELPLSQETFLSLWDGIPDNVRDELLSGRFTFSTNNELINSLQDASVESNASFPITSVPVISSNVVGTQLSSLPPTEDCPGFFNFTVSIPSQGNVNKKSHYLYSPELKRLYVKKDAFCPFNFYASATGAFTNIPLDEGYSIRAMVYFSSPENMNDVVIRCMNHAHADKEKGDSLSQHLLMSESRQAKYFEDSVTKRCSVVVPFENPPLGQDFSSYLYKLTCWTSCSGGPNRRPMCIVFTLEHRGQVLGRRKIDVKVCCCPFRDKSTDEGKFNGSGPGGNRNNLMPDMSAFARDVASSSYSLANITNDCRPTARSPTKRKYEESSGSGKEFVIRVRDEELYKLLKGVEKWFKIMKYFKSGNNWVPAVNDVRNLLNVLTSNSESEDSTITQ